jgi:hypothetical protein
MTAKRDQAASEAAQRRAGGLPDISHLVGKPSPPPADEEKPSSLFDGEPTDGPGWPD